MTGLYTRGLLPLLGAALGEPARQDKNKEAEKN